MTMASIDVTAPHVFMSMRSSIINPRSSVHGLAHNLLLALISPVIKVQRPKSEFSSVLLTGLFGGR